MKFQLSLEKYKPAAKCFLAHLFFIVQGFNQDQMKIIFYVNIRNWYSANKKIDQIRASEIWKSAHTWVKNQLIHKIVEYSKLWYANKARAKYKKQ